MPLATADVSLYASLDIIYLSFTYSMFNAAHSIFWWTSQLVLLLLFFHTSVLLVTVEIKMKDISNEWVLPFCNKKQVKLFSTEKRQQEHFIYSRLVMCVWKSIGMHPRRIKELNVHTWRPPMIEQDLFLCFTGPAHKFQLWCLAWN